MLHSIKMNTEQYVLSGKKINSGFGYLESLDGVIDFSIIHDLITNGEHNNKVMYVIRNCIPEQWARVVLNNFNQLMQEKGSHRLNDGYVSVQQIGSSQFYKNASQYMMETQKAYYDLEKLFDGLPSHAATNLFSESFLMENFLNHNIYFGAARFKHGHACMATFRRWLENGAMSLQPHDDKAQLSYAVNDDFEIAKAKIVVAQNICLEATGAGGELVVWNIQPDDECRRSFDVLNTGYPYPLEQIRHIESFSVRLNVGDIYFMNGCCIHGVKSVTDGNRLTAGRFMGYIPNNKVVYWT